MSAPLPVEIEVEDQRPESYCFRLPRRRLGRLRWFGVILWLIGLFAALSFMASIAVTFFRVNALFHRHVFGLLLFIHGDYNAKLSFGERATNDKTTSSLMQTM